MVSCSSPSNDPSQNGITTRTDPRPGLIPVPLDHLVDGQVVHAEGHTFVAGETVLLAQCAHEVVAEGPKACDPSTVVKATVDAHGNIAQNFTVHRRITVVIGADTAVVDCAERKARCNLSGAAATDAKRAAGSGIDFDPTVGGTVDGGGLAGSTPPSPP